MTGTCGRLSKKVILAGLAICGCQSTAQVAQKSQAANAWSGAVKTPTPQATVTSSSEAPWPMMGGWHHHSPYGQLYFRGKSVTVEGEITKFISVNPLPQMTKGTQIVLKTPEGEKSIHLGPTWYISQQEFDLAPGDIIKVEGRSVLIAGQTVIMANSIQKGSARLELRDANGFPFWAGRRMMRQQ